MCVKPFYPNLRNRKKKLLNKTLRWVLKMYIQLWMNKEGEDDEEERENRIIKSVNFQNELIQF